MHCLQKYSSRCERYLLSQRKHVTVLHNYPLVLEVFLYLSHDDLMTLLMVCKFWAAVAERPQLWTDFRLLVSKYLADCLLLV